MSHEQLSNINESIQEVFDYVTQDVQEMLTGNPDDLIFGTVKGALDTAPTAYFEIAFDTTKGEFGSTFRQKIEEVLAGKPNAPLKELQREIFTASSDTKTMDPGDRPSSGGYKVLLS